MSNAVSDAIAIVVKARANVAKIQGYVDVYLGVERPNERQKAALKTDLGTLDHNLESLAGALQALEDASQRPETPLADLTEDARQLIASTIAAWVTANGHEPSSKELLDALGPDLLRQAIMGNYFPEGSTPGLDRNGVTAKGFTLRGGTQDEGPNGELSVRYVELLLNDVPVAKETTPSTINTDALAWAKSLGYDLNQGTPE